MRKISRVVSSHVARMATPESRSKGGKRVHELYPTLAIEGGKLGGKRAVESGQLRRIATPESCSKGGVAGTHTRWHVARTDGFNPTCPLCFEVL